MAAAAAAAVVAAATVWRWAAEPPRRRRVRRPREVRRPGPGRRPDGREGQPNCGRGRFVAHRGLPWSALSLGLCLVLQGLQGRRAGRAMAARGPRRPSLDWPRNARVGLVDVLGCPAWLLFSRPASRAADRFLVQAGKKQI
ncbi:hypothetical protein P7K49_036590 [Saguinus oedipus]|uniref:Uncharacterized protein n=1 Tax=Saguinus oedipus TaxID=9490 RepID=A0ABQ9TL33_SAGOE|nr:hypothetical protein P7K49_036590 [Saguinus oedipus]